MIRLVTQYCPFDHRGNRFNPGRGWDGADGPFLFHLIEGLNETYGKCLTRNCHSITIEEWTENVIHLTNFRLEFIYE